MRRDARPAQKADTLATRRRAKARDRVPQAWLTIPIVTARPCVEAGGADMLRPLPHSGKGGPGPQRCRLNFAAPGGFRFLSPRRKEQRCIKAHKQKEKRANTIAPYACKRKYLFIHTKNLPHPVNSVDKSPKTLTFFPMKEGIISPFMEYNHEGENFSTHPLENIPPSPQSINPLK